MAKKKFKMNKEKSVGRLMVSVIFIIVSATQLINMFLSIFSDKTSPDILALIVAVLMLFAGIFALLRINKYICRTLGAILFIYAGYLFVSALIAGISNGQCRLDENALMQAAIAWLYIISL